MRRTVFVVEDDPALRELYSYSLEGEFDCLCFGDGKSFFDALSSALDPARRAPQAQPDLILLDIMLPGEDGFTILSRLKSDKASSRIPVMMVSVKSDEVSKVKGLNMGADDYILKPFGVMELIARIKANLRKSGASQPENISYKDICVDFSRRRVTVNGAQIQTTLKEYNLLRLLCGAAGKAAERETIFEEVWGGSFAGESRTLDVHIKCLRKKLAEAGSEAVIQTIRGVGYILT